MISVFEFSELGNTSAFTRHISKRPFKCYVTQMGVSHFSEKKRYEGVMFNIISVTRGWVGVQFPGKKRYVTLEWPQTSHGRPHCPLLISLLLSQIMRLTTVNLIGTDTVTATVSHIVNVMDDGVLGT